MCAFVFLAMLVHLFRIYREYCPKSGLRLVRIPGVSNIIAFMRSISYIRFKQRGPVPLPSLQHCIGISAFFISLIVWVLAIKPYYRATSDDGSPPLAIRTCMVAMALFPFIFACALKVNPISMLTGISHARLQVYHRGLAFTMFVMSLIHAIPFLYQAGAEGGSKKLHETYTSEQQYWTGTVCLCLIFWMLCSSLGMFRNLSYQFFVIQHIVCVCVLLGFLYKHNTDTLYSNLFLWAAVAFWIFSIVVRGCMVLISSEFLVGARANVEVQAVTNVPLEDEKLNAERGQETIRLTFSTPLKWRPGQHIYVRLPGFAPAQAHPFSIMSLPNRSRLMSQVVLMAKVHRGTTRKIFNYVQNLDDDFQERFFESEINTNAVANGHHSDSLPYHATDPEKVVAGDEGKVSPKTAVETGPALQRTSVRQTQVVGYLDGPYGFTTSPSSYEHVTFFAGGTGIAHVLPIFLLLLRRSSENDTKVLTKRIRFVWTTHSSGLVNWLESDLRTINKLRETAGVELVIDVHVTGEVAGAREKTYAQTLISNYGERPDTRAILSEELELAKEAGSTSLATYVCGPPGMVLDVSNRTAAANFDAARGRLGSLKDIMLDAERFDW